MAYQKYTGLVGAAAIMEKMSEYAADHDWVILQNCIADLPIDGSATSDGVLLSMKSPDGVVFGSFRQANGKGIFPTQDITTTPASGTTLAKTNAYGIGLVASTAHTNKPTSGLWFDQPNAPLSYATQEVVGAGVAIDPNGTYTLYGNCISDPAHMLVFSIESPDGVFQHLALGYLQKIGGWDGGIIFSGSRNSQHMFSKTFGATDLDTDSIPLFSMSTQGATYLQCSIDAAPLRLPSVLWASTASPGSLCDTGKQLALPVKTLAVKNESCDAKIPDYCKLQCQTPTDIGRNVSTLNCITVNMNIVCYVLRDPDALRNFSPVGYVPGIYFISMRNVAPAQVYEISYPKSGNLHQVFPYTRRRGTYGMDGFSVLQEKDTTTTT